MVHSYEFGLSKFYTRPNGDRFSDSLLPGQAVIMEVVITVCFRELSVHCGEIFQTNYAVAMWNVTLSETFFGNLSKYFNMTNILY